MWYDKSSSRCCSVAFLSKTLKIMPENRILVNGADGRRRFNALARNYRHRYEKRTFVGPRR